MDNQFQMVPLENESSAFGKRQVRWVVYALMTIAAVFVVSGLLWFWWGRSSSFTERNVVLEVKADSEVASGARVNYIVKFENKNSQALMGVRLVFFYPTDAVVIKDGERVQFLTEEFKIGRLEAGDSGQHEFPAYLVGDRGEVKKAVARLIFTPEKVRSSFEKEATAATNIHLLEVALTLVAPPNAVAGQSIAYLLDYRNESNRELNDLKLEFTYPDGFAPIKFNPAPASGTNVWVIKAVRPGEGNRIVVEGLLRGTEKENKPVTVVLQREIDGVWIDYERAASSTTISTQLLATDITVNNQAGSYIAKLGEALNYQIKFTNHSEIDLTGITVIAKLDGSMYDLGSLQTNGFFDTATRTITWNAASSPLLNRLAPEQAGVVSFTINLKGSFPTGTIGVKDLVAKTNVKAETMTIPPGYFGDSLIAQTELITRIKSLPAFEQVLQYTVSGDNELVSSGPIPPQAEEKTVYTVIWRMSNTAGEVANTRLKAILPAGVSWENKTRVSGSQPQPVYKNSSREVSWEVGVLPSGTGSTTPKYEAWFQIALTPSSTQIGTTPILVKDLILEGEDQATKQVLLLHGKELTTNDLADRPNQGVVGE